MKRILSLLLLTSSISAMELDRVSYADNKNKMYIEPFSVKVPKKLGSLDLYHSKKGFYVRQDDKKQTIKKYFTDPMLRDITKPQLKAFLANGYLTINQMEDGEYSLRAKGRIVGGGPILGTVAYWVTKSLCYGTAVAAVGATVVATGGAVGGAVGGGAFIAGTAVTSTAAATPVATVASGAGLVGAVVTGAGLSGAAATTTVAVVTGAGSVATTIAGVEALSLAVGTFFGMLPTP
jgi:hypothetical protein